MCFVSSPASLARGGRNGRCGHGVAPSFWCVVPPTSTRPSGSLIPIFLWNAAIAPNVPASQIPLGSPERSPAFLRADCRGTCGVAFGLTLALSNTHYILLQPPPVGCLIPRVGWRIRAVERHVPRVERVIPSLECLIRGVGCPVPSVEQRVFASQLGVFCRLLFIHL